MDVRSGALSENEICGPCSANWELHQVLADDQPSGVAPGPPAASAQSNCSRQQVREHQVLGTCRLSDIAPDLLDRGVGLQQVRAEGSSYLGRERGDQGRAHCGSMTSWTR